MTTCYGPRRHRRRRSDRHHRRHPAGPVRHRLPAPGPWPTSTRNRGRSIWTTRSTGSSPASASPTSSPRSPGLRSGCDCSTTTMRVWPNSDRDPAAASTASRRPTCSTNPNSKRCCAPTSSATGVQIRGDVEVTDVAQHNPDGSARPSPIGPTGDEHVVEADLRPRLRRREQHGARPRIGSAHAGSEVRAALAGRRRRNCSRSGPMGRRAPGVRSDARRDVHAHRTTPATAGNSDAGRRDGRRLRHALEHCGR